MLAFAAEWIAQQEVEARMGANCLEPGTPCTVAFAEAPPKPQPRSATPRGGPRRWRSAFSTGQQPAQ
jgi:hypothetical protein